MFVALNENLFEGQYMSLRALDIKVLEDMLNIPEDDHVLSMQAIKICNRLRDQIRALCHGKSNLSGPDLELERLDFEKLLTEIWHRRSDAVLNDYVVYVHTHGGPLDD